MSRRVRPKSTNWSTKSVTEGGNKERELEHKKCHGGGDQLAKVLYRQGGTITESNRVMLGAIFGAIFCGFSL